MRKILDLRGLTEIERNKRIDEAVAEYVAGWKPIRSEMWGFTRWIVKGALPESNCPTEVRNYSTAVDAIIPLLEEYKDVSIERVNGDGWQVALMRVERTESKDVSGVQKEAWEDTVALAACFTLLKNAGIEIIK